MVQDNAVNIVNADSSPADASSGGISYPDGVPRTFIGAFRHWAAEKGDEKFLKCDGDWVSWGHFDEVTDRAAGGLQAMGIGPGTRLAYLAQTSMAMLEVFFASAKLGAVEVPLNVYLRGEFLHHQLAHSQASAVVVDVEGLRSLGQVVDQLPALERIILLGDAGASSADIGETGIAVVPFASLRTWAGELAVPGIEADDLFQVMYTSGTTGPSKGCMISNRYLMRIAASTVYTMGASTTDVRLCSWPMNHVSGAGAVAEAVLLGIPLVAEARFTTNGLIERMAADDATYFVGMGTAAAELLARPPSPADRQHNIRMGMLVPCSVEMQKAIKERFGFDVLSELWAQTECDQATATPIGDERRRPGTSGRPLPDIDLALLDDNDLPVAACELGEICLRPREPGAMFDGYLDDPGATLAAMRNLWFHSGDIGRFDEEGNLTFIDRKKDMLRRSGENISSFELEAALRGHSAVRNAACHETMDVLAAVNEIVAWLVLETDASLDLEEFANYLWESVPYFAVPRFLKIVQELPMTPSGRVQKFELRKRPLGDDVHDLKALGLLTPRDRRR
jgi:crotonobetaine/carnitine-CoA ligase